MLSRHTQTCYHQKSPNSGHPGQEARGLLALLLGARTLLGAKGIATSNKKLLGAPGIATRSKDTGMCIKKKLITESKKSYLRNQQQIN